MLLITMRKQRLSLLVTALSLAVSVSAQDERLSSSVYLSAPAQADVVIPFSISSVGKQYQPEWGLDIAWLWDYNLMKGYAHMGKDNVSIIRSSYRVSEPLVDDTGLATSQLAGLRERLNIIDRFDTNVPVILNCDNGFDLDDNPKVGSNIHTYYTSNKRANIDHWAAMLNAHVVWMQRNAPDHPIVGVGVMNEPDEEGNVYENNRVVNQILIQGNAEDIRDISKKLKQDYPLFENLVIMGANTLNDDKALTWYNTGKQYIDWGNTHQLAGSFDNYAAFHQRLAADGKVGCNDEMHNVMEAFVGLEYGMTKGIWWGFDSHARGEFCNISRHGSRIGYGEHRANWTAGCVYRNDETGAVKGFVGCSERQGVTTNFEFLSTDDVVYFEGNGPYHEWQIELPSGRPNTYQTDEHTSAERVFEVHQGEDVPLRAITAGKYVIMNKYSRLVVGQKGDAYEVNTYSNQGSQQWEIEPVSKRIGGDFGYYHFKLVSNGMRLNVRDHSFDSGKEVIPYNANGDANEQWCLEYAGNGYYFIRNRESALYLGCDKRSRTSSNMSQYVMLSGINQDRLLWRLLPVGAACENMAPNAPSQFVAESREASVALSWVAPTDIDNDLDGYLVYRRDAATEKWNVIARRITSTHFVDNTCRQGHSYFYKVKSIDKSDNLSDASETIQAAPTGQRALVARWQFDGDALDATSNYFDAVVGGSTSYSSDHKSGEQSFNFSNSSDASVKTYVKLPYAVADSDELTIAMWVYWRGTNTTTWQRLFDFGSDTDHYLFLTPHCGEGMRFAIKNGGEEQRLTYNNRLAARAWKHVAVSIGKNKTALFVDGVEVASTTDITIKPSDVHPVLNYLGRSQFLADPYFTGQIDDVQIYNYALDAEGVQQTMNGVASDIALPAADAANGSNIYGLDGRSYPMLRRGLNIVDGRKVIK